MLAIPLFGGGHTCVDEKRFDDLANFAWHTDSQGYAATTIKGKTVLMSRMIMKPSKGKVVDHINGNRILNTESNLRICTVSQNNRNTIKPTRNMSGHKGVRWNTNRNKWAVEIQIDGKNYFIGYFDNLEDAIEASRKAREQLHGEYACFEREEVDMTDFYMAKWHPKSIELFAKKQESKSEGILNLMNLTVIITTTQDQVAIIDIIDHAIVSQYKWRAQYSKDINSYYAVTRARKDDCKYLTLSMRRLIKGAQTGEIVDHINGVTMDNRGNNLRVTDALNNSRNRKTYSSNKSGVPGVCYDKLKSKWVAYYAKDKKQIRIGYFDTKEEAAAARLAVVTVEYGDFLRSIFVEKD